MKSKDLFSEFLNMKIKKTLSLKSILILFTIIIISSPEGFSRRSKIGKDFKKVGRTIKKGVNKVGGGATKFLKEIKNVVKCIPKISNGLAHLAKNPKDKQAFNSLQKCINDVNKMSSTCDKPEILALSAAPEIGGEIGMACGQVGKYDMKLQLFESKMQKAESFMSNPSGAAEGMVMNQASTSANHTINQASSSVNRKINSATRKRKRRR